LPLPSNGDRPQASSIRGLSRSFPSMRCGWRSC